MGTGNPYRRMIAVDLVLKRDPRNESAKSARLQALERIPQPNNGLSASFGDEQLVPAYHAVRTLQAMKPADRPFADAHLDRIRSFLPESTAAFSELAAFCNFVRDLTNKEK